MSRKVEILINEQVAKNGKDYLVINNKTVGNIDNGGLASNGLVSTSAPLEKRVNKGLARIYLGSINAAETVTKTVRIPCELKRDNEKFYLESFNVTGTNSKVMLSVNDVKYVELEDWEGGVDLLHPMVEFQIDVTNISGETQNIPNFIVSLEATTAVAFI